MGMHQGIDLSRFRKVSSDGKTTTLRHSKGHEVKIAHGALSSKMRDTINQMPAFLAEGEDVTAPIPSPSDLPNNEVVPDPVAQEQPPEQPQQNQPSLADPTTPQQAPEQPQSQSPQPAAPEQAPAMQPEQAQQPQQQMPQQEKTVAQMAQDMNSHDMAFQQDLAQGHIQPKTYHELYAKNADGSDRSTLAKLGTLFGLLVGGAGAGLTHSGNPVMEMMDKEIERDLNAQKESQGNAQNWYRLNQQHELQKYQQEQMQAGTEATRAGTYGKVLEGDLARKKLENLGGVNLDASNAAANQMRFGYVQYQQDQINKMPPGPNRDAMQRALDTQIRPAIAAKAVEGNVKTAAKKGFVRALGNKTGQNQPQQETTAVNNKVLNDIDIQNRRAADLGLTPPVSPETISKFKEESKDLETIRKSRTAYHHAYKTLWNLPDKGSLNHSAYNAQVGTLGAQIARETAGKFNMQEASKQMSGIFPDYKDYISGAGKEKYQNMMNYFDSQEAALTSVNQMKDKYPGIVRPIPKYDSPFEKQPQQKSGKSSGPVEGQTGKFNGKGVIWKNGKWNYN